METRFSCHLQCDPIKTNHGLSFNTMIYEYNLVNESHRRETAVFFCQQVLNQQVISRFSAHQDLFDALQIHVNLAFKIGFFHMS